MKLAELGGFVMTDTTMYLTMGLTAFGAITVLAVTGLKGFSGWLDFKRAELGAGRSDDGPALPNAAARIDIADLKERIRKLEAIAAGVEL